MTDKKEKPNDAAMEEDNVVSIDIADEELTIDDAANETEENPLESLQQENAQLKDKLLRMAAEMENLRRRTQKEKEDAGKFAVSKLAREILSVADNMMRAVEHAPKDMDAEPDYIRNLFAGINVTHDDLLNVMAKMGIQKVDTSGVFNPNVHEVMFEAPGTGQPAGTIIQVIEPGYMIHDRLLRPARVGVAAKEAATDSSNPVDMKA